MAEPQVDSKNAPPSVAPERILIVDDTSANLDVLTQLLEGQGYEVLAAPSGEVALRVAARAVPDLILLDVMMPELDGFETCRRLKTPESPSRLTPVIFISARNDSVSVVEGFGAGGVDYIPKPFQADEVLSRVATHLQLSRLSRELRDKNRLLETQKVELEQMNQKLREESARRTTAESALATADQQLTALSDRDAEHWGVAGLVGKSRTVREILDDVRRLRNFASVNVVITGESGTGKELVARAIHFQSARARGPFLPVNCVAIPEELAESMLFGHVRGAFTGATMDRRGYFEMADGGTLFLDEIGDMPVSLQAKLLRVLEDGRVTPLGSTREKTVDVRVLAATNADLQDRIRTGLFREDLYFRLAQFTVEVPPLRERGEDLPVLAEHFLRLFATEMGITPPSFGAGVLDLLAQHSFPGNVRELKNIIERALIESGGDQLEVEHLSLGQRPNRFSGISEPAANVPINDAPINSLPIDSATGDLPLNLEAAEAMLIKRALAATNGNIAEAARRLGVNRTRIYRRLNETT